MRIGELLYISENDTTSVDILRIVLKRIGRLFWGLDKYFLWNCNQKRYRTILWPIVESTWEWNIWESFSQNNAMKRLVLRVIVLHNGIYFGRQLADSFSMGGGGVNRLCTLKQKRKWYGEEIYPRFYHKGYKVRY